MPTIDRRTFLKLMGLSATASGAGLLSACDKTATPTVAATTEAAAISDDFYNLPMQGNVRVLHTTDFHGQLLPVYFREPNVNLGVGNAVGRPPHLVGNKLLDAMNLKAGTPEAYAYTYLDFETAAAKYGNTGWWRSMARFRHIIMDTRCRYGGSLKHPGHRRHGRSLGVHLQ